MSFVINDDNGLGYFVLLLHMSSGLTVIMNPLADCGIFAPLSRTMTCIKRIQF